MTDNTQPAAGSTHIIRYALEMGLLWIDGSARDKVREALDALDTLEAQLASIGAGGVSALMGAAKAGSDGVASLPLPGAQEAVAPLPAAVPVVAPHGWLYDWTHSSATGRPDETYTGFTKDEQHARKHDNCTPVYTAPHPALSAGWVMVPIEPTEAMVSAGYDAFGVHDCYAAMIAAAPTLPVEPSMDGESNW